MKIFKNLLLLLNLLVPLYSMDPPPLEKAKIKIISIDEKIIEINPEVLEQSPVLVSMLQDLKHLTHLIPLDATEEIITIIVSCMQILSNQVDNIPAKKYHEQIRLKIHDLMIVIDTSIGIKKLRREKKRKKILELFSLATKLNLPAVYDAIACIAARDNIFPHTITIDADMRRKISQAKDFLGGYKEEDFENICNSEIKDYTADELIEWGIMPKISVPSQILTGKNYVDHLAEKTNLLSLDELSSSLEHWPASFSEHILQSTLPLIQINLMMNEEFDTLQKLLDQLLAKKLIKQARQAYALLVDYVNGLSKNQIEIIFRNHPQDSNSAFKTALDIIYAKKFKSNLYQPFNQLIKKYCGTIDAKNIVLLNPGNLLAHDWNIMFKDGPHMYYLAERSAAPVIFHKANLKYLLPLLEPLFGNIVGLNLSGKNIVTLDPEMCFLPNLQILILHGNTLSDLPAELEFLYKIVYLDLHNNNFQIVPDCIFTLEKLDTLRIHDNSIDILSTGISLLKKLKCLDVDRSIVIAGNSITQQNLQINCWDELLGRWFRS